MSREQSSPAPPSLRLPLPPTRPRWGSTLALPQPCPPSPARLPAYLRVAPCPGPGPCPSPGTDPAFPLLLTPQHLGTARLQTPHRQHPKLSQTLIPVFQNHLQTLLQSFLQRQRAESCTTTSCWTSTTTRRARRCERFPGLPSWGKTPDLTGNSFFWQPGTAGHSWSLLLGTLTSSMAELGGDLSKNRAQPSAKLGVRPQKKLNDLGLDNGFQTLGWKEGIPAGTRLGSVGSAATGGISRNSNRIRSRTLVI